ncbi:epidermal growth factor receptor substrate 15-like 1 [Daktulosphaira vitifoliae]|uniref:epidermal growth factor receptor substrate 15-like 1 n=1 Tax=Daktulosphaira vitifoliae TaxID=58002 RepID=UPI0021AA64AB|nr:epidermal growth factor receptor substrate 15-like 1 [Daktulosphaira vitifoliae]
MASLPSPNDVAGNHYPIYDAFYNMVDPTNKGNVGAIDAANFLKKSGLSQVILSQIWDLSDPTANGFLTKPGFFVALKLIALAQAGQNLSISNITQQLQPPNMGEASKLVANKVSGLVTPSSNINDWSMKPAERLNYDKMFESLRPLNGTVSGDKVKGLLIDSKLSVDTLGKIWDLADMDKDGKLNQHEFAVAMHLVYKALEKYAIPAVLPAELLPSTKRKTSIVTASPIPILPVLPSCTSNNLVKQLPVRPISPSTETLTSTWVVTADDKSRYESMFIESDKDLDGFVSGSEIKDRFLKTGIPSSVLAHIWSLCDIKQQGKLDIDQFCLAMWFVERKLKGINPPHELSADMMPPSCRNNSQNNTTIAGNEMSQIYSNPELNMIQKDIDELVKERLTLETEITQKDADLKIRLGEVKSLQSELDTLSATLKQLENQKGEAQKRLNDLRNQTELVESQIKDINRKVKDEQVQVDSLRKQSEDQENLLKSQESELASKKQELDELKSQEHKLENEQTEMSLKLEKMNKLLQNSQLQISQIKNKVNQIEENKYQMENIIESTEKALAEGNLYAIPDSLLSLNLEFRDIECSKLLGKIDDDKNMFENVNGFTSADQSNNSFKTDLFANNDAFSANNKSDDFSHDPFTSFDDSRARSQSTDPFGGDSNTSKLSNRQEDKDAFGCDPFAILHAPTRPSSAPPQQRPESPTPALPPKKGKQPPPRPAPPRPAPYTPSSQTNSSTISEFADFSNFNSKFLQSTKTEAKIQLQSNSFEFTEDPFKDYRYEDPFKIDPFSDTGFETDPFGDGAFSSDDCQKIRISDEQFAWEAQKKFRIEEEKARLEQEKADFELALRLSKATTTNNRSKILL